jgi:NADPH:quinone reductase-like Zn-dependent oxidoreductase
MTEKMKAIVYTKYGSPEVLRLENVEKPTPKAYEVLIKIHAAALTAGDGIVVEGKPLITRLFTRLTKPKNTIPGKEMAGRVEAVGENVTQFKPGDKVYGDLSVARWSAFAEYVSVPENAVANKPENLTFEQAAAVPESCLVALQALRDEGQIKPGQKVLINGASGGVGSFAVQIAKSFGAEVTAVCSTRNMDLARSLGAEHVIDYTKEDFTQNGKRYNLILAANGYHPISDYRRSLNPEGIYVATGGSMAQSLQASMIGPILSQFGGKKMGGMMVKPNQDDLVFKKELIESGMVKPVIDRSYPLSEITDAFHFVGEGRAQGKVVINVAQNGSLQPVA